MAEVATATWTVSAGAHHGIITNKGTPLRRKSKQALCRWSSITLALALQWKARFQRPVGVHGTPMCFVRRSAIVANRCWFPGLVKGFKVENVDSPFQHATYTLGIISGCEVGIGCCGAVFGTASGRPSCLAVPKLDAIKRAGNLVQHQSKRWTSYIGGRFTS